MFGQERLIRELADGRLLSGSELASRLGLTRSAVWKQIHRLRALGLEIEAQGGRGYRLLNSLELLDARVLLTQLGAPAREACEGLEISWILGSTSSSLARQPTPMPGCWRASLAEYQTGGRGRRGRRWSSPFGSGLCLSLSWCFPSVPRDLAALSLVGGIAVLRALQGIGARGLALKWPNDILVDGTKLAGILVDVDGDGRGPLRAIIGVGVNISAPASLVATVTQDGGLPPGCLEQAVGSGGVGRNALAGALISSLYAVLQEFSRTGFEPFVPEWQRHDYMLGRCISVRRDTDEIRGICRGIRPDGALLVEVRHGVVTVLNGDVTLRTDM